MSMSTNVVGFIPPDEQYQKMRSIYDACVSAGVNVPKEVEKFFDYQKPNDEGTVVIIRDAVSTYSDGDMCDGLQVQLSKLPKGVTVLRFVNCF